MLYSFYEKCRKWIPLVSWWIAGGVSCIGLNACQYKGAEQEEVKRKMGHYLFFDKRLSATNAKSCSSCHDPKLAFTDGYRKSPGIYADLHFRNTPGLVNNSRQYFFNWANPDITSVAEQMEGPLFGIHPVEMGLSKGNTDVLTTLSGDPVYQSLLKEAGAGTSFTWEVVKECLSAYVRSLNSYAAPYDRFREGETDAISASAIAGAELFFSPGFGCAQCHRPPLFGADSTMRSEDQFANIGLYNYRDGNYPETDQGVYEVTGRMEDRGKFKVPTLRNLKYTAPYFHDGSAETLHDVLEVYRKGGRDVNYGKWEGDGRQNPNKHPAIGGIDMTAGEKQQLLDFLDTLNDSTIAVRPDFQSPFNSY